MDSELHIYGFIWVYQAQAGRKPKASEQRGKISKNFVLASTENQDPFTKYPRTFFDLILWMLKIFLINLKQDHLGFLEINKWR